jgi:hypothetical protein
LPVQHNTSIAFVILAGSRIPFFSVIRTLYQFREAETFFYNFHKTIEWTGLKSYLLHMRSPSHRSAKNPIKRYLAEHLASLPYSSHSGNFMRTFMQSILSTFRLGRVFKRIGCTLTFSAALIPTCPAEDVSVSVPNGDFETAGNNGAIGGSGLFGLVGPNDSAFPMAGGPWGAATWGILGLISPPRITINANGAANGNCRISGLAGLQVLNTPLLNTHAVVSQTLTSAAEPYVVYTLEADIDRSTLLSATLLAQDGVGIGLTINGTQVASSLTATGTFLSIQLLSGTTYHLTLKYATGEVPPAGPLGIRLFTGEGSGLLHTGVLSDVVFDNVRLTASRLEA